MPDGRDFPARILLRAAAAGVPIQAALASKLGAYLQLLQRWNRTVNLTGFSLEPASDAAIDRLILEPIAAASYLEPTDRCVVDVGSGGGSPALPMKLACPEVEFVLVESKTRKAAFLREVIRALELEQTHVENHRLEELDAAARYREWANIVTLRAVRIEPKVLSEIDGLLSQSGRIFFFGNAAAGEANVPGRTIGTVALPGCAFLGIAKR